MTYAETVDSLVLWLNREGFATLVAQAPEFIAMGQRRIHRECDLKAMEEVSALTVDAQVKALPSDLLRVKTITLTRGSGTSEVLGAPFGDVMRYVATECPRKFAVVGTNLYFGPPPDQTYTAQLVYYKRLPILSVSNTTNWLSENEPEMLLFAALMEAAMFLKDDARAQIWEARFQALKESLVSSEARMDKPYGTLQVRNA